MSWPSEEAFSGREKSKNNLERLEFQVTESETQSEQSTKTWIINIKQGRSTEAVQAT
jgi:hypothetical protein